MTSLPSTPFDLHGSCFCKAITYTIHVPAITSRPLIPRVPERQIIPLNETTSRYPIISLDHCTSCRKISGAIVECWFNCQHYWVDFSLLLKSSSAMGESESDEKRIQPATIEVLNPRESLMEQTYLRAIASSELVKRTFCSRCGTHLTFLFTGDEGEGKEIWGPTFNVAVGSLDRESLEMEGLMPVDHAFWADGISWVHKLVEGGVKTCFVRKDGSAREKEEVEGESI
jgi:hypothetical protein